MRYFIILTAFFILSLNTYSQNITEFSQNNTKFLKQLSNFIEKNNAKKGKALFEKFEPVWTSSPYFTSNDKQEIIINMNKMLKKRCRNVPHFTNYLNTIIAFSNSQQSSESYHNWNSAFSDLLKGRKTTLRKIQFFLAGTYELIENNNIYKSTTTTWKTDNKNYKYTYDKKLRIIFSSLNLKCYAKTDSLNIYSTKGTYFPLTNKWIGKGGKVTWERANYSPDSVFAILKHYKIDMKKSNYEADSVIFTNSYYFDHSLEGFLKEKILAHMHGQKASYPRFKSYSQRFTLKNIYKNVDYDGGFSMKGAKFIGSGNENNYASIKIYRNDTLFFIAKSKLFIFNKNDIISSTAIVTFRLDTDSIYHPGLYFKFNKNKRNVTLIRDGKKMTRSPFYDTFHKVEIDVGEISWNIDDPKIDFSSNKGTTNQVGKFQSTDFYSQKQYLDLQGMDEQNPLVIVRKFVKYSSSEEFPLSDFADFLRASIPQTKQYIMRLAFAGFVDYNFDTKIIKVKQKLYDYLRASVGKKDYDVIKFNSKTGANKNASLSLLNYELKIHGVHLVHLSDSQNVAIYPRGEEITLLRNRDFEFEGKVRAGNFLFRGTNFYFNYDRFKIDMPNVDALKMQVATPKRDDYGFPIMITVRSTIENVKGELLIDQSNNKSGNKSLAQYPIFKSEKNSFVYYDKKSINKGVYKRDKFYFQIFPYEIDSLNTFSTNSLGFDGHFVSGGIFPPFDQKLRVMPDYSLGFIRKSPPNGIPVYGGKGKFHNDIRLSNQGLKGNGDFTYLTSITKSNDFNFFPDSMNTHAQSFNIKKQISGVEYPTVQSTDAYIHWLPYNDELYASDKKKPFNMYDDQATLHGTLKLQPTGLNGWGKSEFAGAQLFSKMFNFYEHTIDADTANFNLKEIEMEGLAFKTINVKSHVDFNERKAEFKSNGKASFVELPANQYICFMNQFTWWMDKAEIEMSASKDALQNQKTGQEFSPTEQEDIQIEGSRFISIHPKQDSLNFIAPSAIFSLRKHKIKAKDVRYIRVADAVIYPGDGKVIIEKKAKMQPLVNSKIIANITTRYYTIYNANTNIYGRKDYSASGDYDYIDETNRKQTLHFNVIGVDSTFETYGTGNIGITDGFTLSPNFAFTGRFKMLAKNKYLTFTGSTQISHECDAIKRQWINFSAEINPDEIYIPIGDEVKDINNNVLFNGFLITNDSAHIYGTFFNKHKKYSDKQILSAKGFLFFDKADKKYKVSSKEKLNEFNLPGNYLSLSKTICNLYGEGKINLGTDLGQVKLNTVGSINEDFSDTSVNLETVIGMNFFFADKSLEIMANDFMTATGLDPVDIDNQTFTKGLAELVGKELAEKLLSDYALKGQLKKIPKELKYTILFSDLKFKWNSKTHSYLSDGKIGIGNIGKYQINKYVDGIIEIVKKRGGSKMNMYLSINDNQWYLFSYTRGVMRAYSTNEQFNTEIKILKPDERKLKVEKGQPMYNFYPTNLKFAQKIIKKYKKADDEEQNNEEGGIEDTEN